MNTAEKSAIEIASQPKAVASVTVTLDQPIEIAGQMVTSVTVSKPKTGALMGISLSKLLHESDFGTVIKMIARCTSPQISELHIKNDLVALSDIAVIHGEICAFFMTTADREALPPIG